MGFHLASFPCCLNKFFHHFLYCRSSSDVLSPFLSLEKYSLFFALTLKDILATVELHLVGFFFLFCSLSLFFHCLLASIACDTLAIILFFFHLFLLVGG